MKRAIQLLQHAHATAQHREIIKIISIIIIIIIEDLTL